MLTKRPCCICRRWFVPDRRVGRRQRACSAPACQIARRAQTQASWRRRNPDYFIAHRLQHGVLLADDGARPPVPPLVLPPPLSQLPWDLAQDEFGVVGTDFLGHLGRVLLGRRARPEGRASRLSRQEKRADFPREPRKTSRPGEVIEDTGLLGRLPRPAVQDAISAVPESGAVGWTGRGIGISSARAAV